MDKYTPHFKRLRRLFQAITRTIHFKNKEWAILGTFDIEYSKAMDQYKTA
jgi:hypothetical protein